ncbi:MAG: COG1361 S-layer family protein [Dethiobacteraceae bacterium]|jgi:uncharacterized membrane protein
MSKRKLALLTLLLYFFCFIGAVQAAETEPTTITLLTEGQLEVMAGEKFAVKVSLTRHTAGEIKLAALSSAHEIMAQSEKIAGLTAGTPREVILYGVSQEPGLKDISQIQVLSPDGALLETVYVDALLIKAQPKPAAEEAVRLRLSSFSVSPFKNDEFTLKLTVKNLGVAAAQNVTLQFNGEQAFVRGSSNVVPVQNISAGAGKDVTVKMGLAAAESPVYTIPVTVSCFTPAGEKVTFAETITVTANDLGIKVAAPAVGTPRVFLQKYTLSKDSILAGDTVKLTLYVQNSSNREVRNLKISLAAIPSEDSTSGTVFSPVNSSNSFFVERIGAKSTYSKTIELYVDPNATAKTYLVPVEILYEDQQGTGYNVSEMVNIPVLQESRLQILNVEVPQVAALGEPSPVTAEFVNVGKVALKNLMVTLEGDFPKENASLFLASFEIGQSEFYQAYITPQQEGVLEGKVIFTYTDNSNQEVVTEWPFSVEVQQMALPGPERPEEPLPIDPPRRGPNYITIIVSILLLAALVGVILWRRKVKRGEIFDEEL